VFCNVSIVESINFNFKFWSSFFLFLFQLLLILNLWLRLELFLQFITFLILNSRLWFIFIDFQFTDILWLIPINFTYFNSIIFIRGLKNILFLFFLFLILLSNSWFLFLWLHLIWLSNFVFVTTFSSFFDVASSRNESSSLSTSILSPAYLSSVCLRSFLAAYSISFSSWAFFFSSWDFF